MGLYRLLKTRRNFRRFGLTTPEPDLENLTIDLARHAHAVEQRLKRKSVTSAGPESAPESRSEKVPPIR